MTRLMTDITFDCILGPINKKVCSHMFYDTRCLLAGLTFFFSFNRIQRTMFPDILIDVTGIVNTLLGSLHTLSLSLSLSLSGMHLSFIWRISHRSQITLSAKGIDFFHIVIFLSLAARYLARFRVTSQTWGKL